MKAFIIISVVVIAASSLALFAYFHFASNVYTKAMEECKNRPQECRMQCFGKRLGFIDSNGTILPEHAPFGHLISNLTLMEGCEEAKVTNDACARTTALMECIFVRLYEIAEDASSACANETSVENIQLTREEIVSSFKDPGRACFNLCLLRKFHAVDGEGNLRAEVIFKNVELFTLKDLRGSVKKCAKEESGGGDLCQIASKRALCVGSKLLYKIGLPELVQMKILFF